MSTSLRNEILWASQEAPIVDDPDQIPSVVNAYDLCFDEKNDLVKKGKKRLKIYWQLLLGLLVIIPVAAFLIGVNAPRGSAPLILPVLTCVWLHVAGIGTLGFFILLIRNHRLKREANEVRSELISLVGIANKNAMYFTGDNRLWRYNLQSIVEKLDAT